MMDKNRDYFAYGLRIRSSVALPFRAAPAPDGESRAAADVTVSIGATPPQLPNPAAKRRLETVAWEAAPDAFLIRVDNEVRCLVTDGCSILVEPLGGGEREMGAFLVGSPFAALLQQRGLTTLGAGAIKAEAGAALFAGRKGAGESALLGALVELGCALLSDGFTGVEASAEGRFLALPAATSLLSPAARLCTEPTAVRALYVLKEHQGDDIEIRPASRPRAREALLMHTYRPRFLHGFGRQSAHFFFAAGMAARVPVFHVRRPASSFQLQALAERIAVHLRSEAAAHPPPFPSDGAKETGLGESTPEAAVPGYRKVVGALGGRGGLFERAEAVLRRRLAADPNDAEALLRLGDLLRGEGRLDAALDAYRRALELRPVCRKASWLCAVLGGADLPDAPRAPDAWPAPFVRVRNFLPADEHAALLAKMLAGREHFSELAGVGAGYIPDAMTRNNSEANRRFAAEARLGFEPRLRKLAEDAAPRLGMRVLGAYRLDLKVRTYQTGEFYAAHSDFSEGDSTPREINYVYYLHRRPKSFSGGDLLLHDGDLGGLLNAFTRIEPEDNSIVLFPSRCVHEVTEVKCDPGDFGAGRFSLNGALWKLRADGC